MKSSALQTVENRTVVFVRNGEKFEARDVEIGDRDKELVEINQTAVLGQLRLVGFARPELLRPVGDSLLQSDQAPFELGAGQANVVSGVIEKSNVETSREVSRLEEVVRSYEMVGRLLKSSQDVADINKLGNVPD